MDQKTSDGTLRRIAIVGGGPAGLFATAELLRSGAPVAVDLFEQWWAPFGLLRYGVAPDHVNTRRVAKTLGKWFDHNAFRFFGNVRVGRDIAVSELARHYDAVLLATGAELDRRLAIPGAELPGCHTSLEFVGWYNAHPEHAHRRFPLDAEAAVIIGNGNVAIDVARILCKDPGLLAATEISRPALEALQTSRIHTVTIVGRRGLAQTSFTYNELHELAALEGVELDILPEDLRLDEADRAYIAGAPDALVRGQVIAAFRELAARPKPPEARRRIAFRFNLAPTALEGDERVERIRLRSAGGGPEETLTCGLVVKSIGHRGSPLPGLPFDPVREVIPCREGRVVLEGGEPLRPFYAAGWIESGARGLVGHNKPDAKAVAETLLRDLPGLPLRAETDPAALARELAANGVRPIGTDDWKRIADEEERRGDRFTRWDEVRDFLSLNT